MDINLQLKETKRVFIDTAVGEIFIRQNDDGTVSVTIEGDKIAIALEAENAFRIIPNTTNTKG